MIARSAIKRTVIFAFLDSKQQFSDWIKARVKQFGFEDGQGFTVHKFMNGRVTFQMSAIMFWGNLKC